MSKPDKLVNMTEPEITALLQGIGRYISSMADTHFFVLLTDDPGMARYVSNANRQDVIKVMEEAIEYFKNNPK